MAPPFKQEIRTEDDLMRARHATRELVRTLGFGLVDQTRLVTAVSELTRNAYRYAGGGDFVLGSVEKSQRVGVRVTVSDRGPGIRDLDQALTEGYSTSGGLGHGLSGSRRLVDEFDIQTEVGKGTTVVIVKYR